jgi:hypothetical protein
LFAGCERFAANVVEYDAVIAFVAQLEVPNKLLVIRVTFREPVIPIKEPEIFREPVID